MSRITEIDKRQAAFAIVVCVVFLILFWPR